MKKLLILAALGLFLFGCAPGYDWMKHDTIFKRDAHMKYSFYGYKNPTPEDFKKSEKEGWWGKTTPGD